MIFVIDNDNVARADLDVRNHTILGFAGGNGTLGNPFQISNVTHLQNMSANLSAHYILVNDIDASATSGWNSEKGFVPIGTDTNPGAAGFQGTPFSGSFNGDHYTITSLTVNRSSEDYIGLFGNIASGGEVTNVTLVNANMTGDAFVGTLAGNNFGNVSYSSASGKLRAYNVYCGGLVGFNDLTGIVSYSSASTEVTGSTYSGGLVGPLWGHIHNCSASGDVSGIDNVGGLVARINPPSSVLDSHATGNVSGRYTVGGLAGILEGIVNNTTAAGSVTSSRDRVGGLIGHMYSGSTLSNSTAWGDVTATNGDVGGLVGRFFGTISDCEAFGNVSGLNNVGGLIGIHYGTVLDCIAWGNVVSEDYYAGGFAGQMYGTLSGSRAYGDVEGAYYAGGFAGYSEASVDNSSSFGNVSGALYVGGFVGSHNINIIENCMSSGDNIGALRVGGFVGDNHGIITKTTSFGNASGLNDVGAFVGRMSDGNLNNVTARCHKPVGIFVGDHSGGIIENYTLVMTSVDDETMAYEDTLYIANFSSYGSDWDVETDANWLSETSDGVLSGTPRNNDIGSYYVNISRDSGSVYENYTVTVINNAPQILTDDQTQILTGQQYENDYNSSEDGDAGLIWSVTGVDWLSIDNTGLLNGTPTVDEVGLHSVNVSVSDSHGAVDFSEFQLEVILDTDGDGIADTLDSDDDDDGWMDYIEDIVGTDPLDGQSLPPDMDGDNVTDVLDSDMDGDGINDTDDEFPSNTTEWIDTDNDGIGDNSDIYPLDYDNDGHPDTEDFFPFDPYRWEQEVINNTQYVNTTTIVNHTVKEIVNKTIYVNTTIDNTMGIDEIYLEDTDGDGMPDSWELLYDLDPNDPDDAGSDEDGDGVINLDEYIGDTSPLKENGMSDTSTDGDEADISQAIKDTFSGLSIVLWFVIALLVIALVVLVIMLKRANPRADSENERDQDDEVFEGNLDEEYEEEEDEEELGDDEEEDDEDIEEELDVEDEEEFDEEVFDDEEIEEDADEE